MYKTALFIKIIAFLSLINSCNNPAPASLQLVVVFKQAFSLKYGFLLNLA
jgi:hypothetical protein